MMRLPLVLALVLALLLVSSARAQSCWQVVSPVHGTNGTDVTLMSSVIWDAGTGPRFVVGPSIGTFDQVRYWENGRWNLMPGTFNGTVHALAVYNGSLYAGGSFTQIGALTVNGIARWNGTSWVQVGTHLINSPLINTFQVFGGQLWVGGRFGRSGQTGTHYWATWNGTSWTSGGNQTAGDITSFTLHNGQLFAGTGASNGGAWRWTGSTWERIGEVGGFARVNAVASFSGSLIAAGTFSTITTPGGTPVSASRIARWNGSTWAPLAGGLSPATGNDRIIALKVYNSRLIAAGRFSFMNGQPMTKIAAWDGINWNDMGGGIQYMFNPPTDNDAVYHLDIFNNQLIASGIFNRAGNRTANRIARYDGDTWHPFIEGINGRVRAFLASGSTIYAGGDFVFDWSNIGRVNRLMRVTGQTVDPMSSIQTGSRGTSGNVLALGFHTFNFIQGPRLIIGGAFSSAGGVSASNIASFDLFTTSGYAALGQGLNGPVTAVASYSGSIYAAGSFTGSGSTSLSRLARFSSGNWVAPGAWTFPNLNAMIVHDGRLVIGGHDGGTHGVSALEGSTLHSYGVANGAIRAFAIYEGELIAAGDFSTIGGMSAMRIARRNSATGQWMPMGNGLGGPGLGNVNALVVHRGDLYAGGSFVQSGTTPMYRLARWTGSAWQAIPFGIPPGGVDGAVHALGSVDGTLHVGGDFSMSTDERMTPHWLRYVCAPCYANCDNSTVNPVLNVDDFTCFINRFAQGSSLPAAQQINHYANCDGSTSSPVLNVDDFTCFINKFAAGCP